MSILDQIREQKISEVQRVIQTAQKNPLWLVEAMKTIESITSLATALRGTRGPHGERVSQTTLRVIAEIKKASPSKGVIRADVDPAAIARSYERGGASGISVLTDSHFFQGSLENLRLAHAAVKVPILRKEFILSNFQVHEARVNGADAILLIAGFVPWDKLRALRHTAFTYGLEVVLEIHSLDELDEALKLRPDILGINNRDLRSPDLATDLARTAELLPHIPPDITVISESGIRNAEDVAYLTGLGVDGILVGEHLMREPDPGAAIASKLGIVRQPALSTH